MASFSVSGLVPMSAAIAGSDVAMTVESMFSMNKAVATMSGIRRSLFIRIRGGENRDGSRGCTIPLSHKLLRNRGNHLNHRDPAAGAELDRPAAGPLLPGSGMRGART